jgi:predicted NAD/FAD-binding protein
VKRVAVIGAGVSGLAAAYALRNEAHVTLFEAEPRFGGHAHTVDITLDGVTHGVDTGFLVFNHRTYPNLLRLFDELRVDTAPSEMSFSVQVPQDGLEWSGSNLASVFAQRRNLLRPAFHSMLAQILRFNRQATALAESGGDAALAEPIGDFLAREGYRAPFRDWYLLPMVGCIWSCPTEQMLRFPIGTLIRFCHNHGLIQVTGRPQWHTVRGGSRQYVRKILAHIADARAGIPVLGVRRVPPGDGHVGVLVATASGTERFDDVVFACHSDQALALLGDARTDERALLGAIRYQPNRAVLHTDAALLPQRRSAWAAWNYARAASAEREQARVCLHYLINRLQPLPWQRPVIVSLNPDPAREPADAHVLGEFDYSHPVFDLGAVAAQKRLAQIQGRSRVWFCGAWTRYGFHEDGLVSALEAVRALRASWQSPQRPALPAAA